MNNNHIQGFRRTGFLTLLFAALALALGIAFRSAFKENIGEAKNQAAGQDTQPAPKVISLPKANAPLETPVPDENLTQTVNGVDISVSNARLDGSRLKIDVCYDKPDSGNWLLRDATLQYGRVSVSSFSASPIELRDPPTDGRQKVTTFENGEPVERWETAFSAQKGRRCDTLAFEVEPVSGDTDYTLTIKSIWAQPNEGAECEVYLTKVQKALDARKLGIRLSCTQEGWGANISITSKPASMSQEEAEKIVFAGEWFTIKGPWIFTDNLK